MTTEITLPGGTAVLKDKSELTNKEMKRLSKAQMVAAAGALHAQELGFDKEDKDTWVFVARLTPEEMDAVDTFQRAAVVERLVSWTLPRPMPQNIDEVDDLPLSIYTPLTIAAADIKIGDDEFEVSPDPKARIENSSDSS